MTTIYVNHNLGVVLTDTRTTSTWEYHLFGFKIGEKVVYNDNGQKAMYVHDRIFVESGSCEESNKILQYFIDGTPIVPADKKQGLLSVCFLVSKSWTLKITIDKGELKKTFIPCNGGEWYAFGSGGEHIMPALKEYGYKPTLEQAVLAMKTAHFSDKYTNNQVEIYTL